MAHPTDAELAFAAVSPRVPPDPECDTMTADQQIRAKALECAILLHMRKWELLLKDDAEQAFESLYGAAEEFGYYIRDGK